MLQEVGRPRRILLAADGGFDTAWFVVSCPALKSLRVWRRMSVIRFAE
jgi:hypothetical protein